jgi:hypothetical protein
MLQSCTKFSAQKWGGIQWQILPRNLNSPPNIQVLNHLLLARIPAGFQAETGRILGGIGTKYTNELGRNFEAVSWGGILKRNIGAEF